MASVVAVHGIGQQFKGQAVIHREWWPALESGLILSGHTLGDPAELVCPFYGNLFRKAEALGAVVTEARGMSKDELLLLDQLWDAAAEAEPDRVPSRKEFAEAESLVRWPQMAQRALIAMSKSAYWVNIAQPMMIGDLRQVVLYMNDAAIRERALQTVMDAILPDTRVVVGHSLGSVVAFEALCQKPSNVLSFVSLGSPLGIRNVIFDRLTPGPNAMGAGAWPGKVKHWTNIADRGDIVATPKQLAPMFDSRVKDVLVYNGSDAHHGERYLTTREAGEAIRAGLWRSS